MAGSRTLGSELSRTGIAWHRSPCVDGEGREAFLLAAQGLDNTIRVREVTLESPYLQDMVFEWTSAWKPHTGNTKTLSINNVPKPGTYSKFRIFLLPHPLTGR